MSAMQLRFFGQPQLSIDGHTVDLKSRKGWALLAYLAATDRAHSRDLLATLFWPEHTQTRARGNLRRLLFTLNQSPAGAWLQADSDTIALRMTSDGQIDLWDFAAHMAQGDVIAAAALYRDDFLGGVLLGDSDDFERWATQQREFYRREVIGALENLTQAEIAGGQYGAALAHARRQLRIDPLQESAYRQAMTALALSGRRSEALLLFEQGRQQLQDALGLDPGSDTVALQARIRADTLDAPAAAAEPVRGGRDVTPRAVDRADLAVPRQAYLRQAPAFPLVGRGDELAQIEQQWQQAHAGHGSMLLLDGEPGIGKSRLVEEVLHKVADDGGHALRVTCFQMEQAMPYHPIIDLVEQIRRVQPPEFWRGLPTGAVNDIALLVPAVADDAAGEHVAPTVTPVNSDEAQQTRLLRALTHLLEQLLQQHTLLLVIDDVQWADEATLSFLHYVGRRLEAWPALFIFTYRQEGRLDSPHLADLIQTLVQNRHVAQLHLRPLHIHETEELLRVATGATQAAQALAVRLQRESDGNPFFLLSILQSLEEEGLIQPLPGGGKVVNSAAIVAAHRPQALSEALKNSVRVRLQRVPDGARQLLDVAAVFGASFSFRLLQAITQRTPLVLLEQLEELVQRQLLREVTNQAYDFSHDKIREVVYDELRDNRRRVLHRVVAETLEQMPAASDQLMQLAYHYEQSGVGEKALLYLTKAAVRATELFAGAQALDYYARALTFVPAGDWAQHYALHEACERILGVLGQRRRQWQELTVLTQLALDLDDVSLRATTALRRAAYAQQTSQYARAIDAAHEALQLAAKAGNDAPAVEATLILGRAYLRQGNYELARRYAHRTLDGAVATGPQLLEGKARRLLGQIAHEQGSHDEARAQHLMALGLAQAAGDRLMEAETLSSLGELAHEQVDYDAAQRDYEQGLTISRQAGYRRQEGFAANNLGWLAWQVGDYPAAEVHLRQALAIADEIADRRNMSLVQINLGYVAEDTGDLAAACRWQEHALAVARAIGDQRLEGYALTGLGSALTGLGRPADAVSRLDQAYALRAELQQPHLVGETQAALARARLAQGDPHAAFSTIADLLAYIEAGRPLEGAESPFRIYLTCYQVLLAVDAARAQAMLDRACRVLQEKAHHIHDDAVRHRFLHAVPWHRLLMDAKASASAHPPS